MSTTRNPKPGSLLWWISIFFIIPMAIWWTSAHHYTSFNGRQYAIWEREEYIAHNQEFIDALPDCPAGETLTIIVDDREIPMCDPIPDSSNIPEPPDEYSAEFSSLEELSALLVSVESLYSPSQVVHITCEDLAWDIPVTDLKDQLAGTAGDGRILGYPREIFCWDGGVISTTLDN